MMIEDDELRLLYKTSSEEHIQKLESDLMILEKNPEDTAALEEFLREAHTLKGDSRMLGLDDIEMLVHHLEDCVEGIKAGQGEITPELCDRLYQGIDAIDRLAHHAVTGESVEVDTFAVLATLMGTSELTASAPNPGSNSNSEADLFDDDDNDFFSPVSNSVTIEADLFDQSVNSSEADLFDDDDDFLGAASNPTSSEADLFDDDDDDFFGTGSDPTGSEVDVFDAPLSEVELAESDLAVTVEKSVAPAASKIERGYKIDTIRVEPQKLDLLMTQASELTVTKLRISQQIAEIEQINNLWSGWSKQDQSMLSEIEQALEPEVLQPLKQFLQDTEQRIDALGKSIVSLKTRANEDIASLEIISDRLESGINGLRQLPLATVFNIYPRMVRDLARQLGKEIEFVIEGEDTKADKRILEEIKDPLLHLIRNAIDHGIETPAERIAQGKSSTAKLILRGYQTGSSIRIEISDDGQGLNIDKIAQTAIKRQVCTAAEIAEMEESEIQSLIFASGFSTRNQITELSGRGVGLDVVRANVERLKGGIQVSSKPGHGCKFQVSLHTSLATTKVLILEIVDTFYALPLEFIKTMVTLTPKDFYEIEGKTTVTFEDKPLSVTSLARLLQLPEPENERSKNYLACIILQVGNDCFGVIVDQLVDRQDIVIKPQSKLLKRVPNISGATILGNGSVCMILNPTDLLHSLRNGSWQSATPRVEQAIARNRLLLVEDSIIIRTQMERLLKGAGYEVTIAENGLLGLQQVQTGEFDIVLSDVEMPQMSGLEMTAAIRQNNLYDNLPIVLITTLSSAEDKLRGKNAGANAYLTKGDFDQQLLFETLEQLIYAHH